MGEKKLPTNEEKELDKILNQLTIILTCGIHSELFSKPLSEFTTKEIDETYEVGFEVYQHYGEIKNKMSSLPVYRTHASYWISSARLDKMMTDVSNRLEQLTEERVRRELNTNRRN